MIYLIQSNNKLKIGYTKDLTIRLKQYKTHNLDVKLIDSKKGELIDEKLLHSICLKYKIENEWFEYNQFIIELFKNYPENNTIDYIKITSVDSFYMTFIDYAAPFFNLKQGVDKTVIAKLCSIAEFNTGKVKLTTQGRKEICDQLEISNQQLTNSFGRLKKLKLLNGSNGEFIINPQIFWKGDLESRNKILNSDGFKLTFNIISNN